MSVAESLKAHLPSLRRYARALAGSEERGDACVETLLETLLEQPHALVQGMETRLALFRMLDSVVATSLRETKPQGSSVHAWEATAFRRLETLHPDVCRAFVLVFVEGFDVADAATVLDCDEGSVRALLSSAVDGIASQIANDILMIEDEPILAMELEQVVERLGHTVSGIARTHGEAMAIFSRSRAGLVIADIRLADGTSGIDAVGDMLARSGEAPPILFVTAYPERLLTGARPEPTFLITKPFMADKIKAIVSQILFFDGTPEAVA